MINLFFFSELIFVLIFLIFITFYLVKKKFYTYDLYVNRLFTIGELEYNNIYICLIFLIFWYVIFQVNLLEQDVFFSFFSFFSNNFIIVLKLLIVLFFLFTIFVSKIYLKINNLISISFEFIIIISLSLIGSLLLISSNDFLTLFLSLELQSLSFYVLAAYKQVSIFSIEAGLKYFILGSFSSGIFVFGVSLFYGFLGIYNLIDLKYFFLFERFVGTLNIFIILSLIFIFVSLLFKFSAAPFHIWAPDVYQGAPTLITFFFSVVPKLSYFGIFLNFFFHISNIFIDFYIRFLFLTTCICSLIIGSIAALIQKKIKRLLAYSSIANVGFILIGFSTSNIEGFASSLIYFFIYNLVTVSIFYLILTVSYYHNGLLIKNVNEFFSMLNENLLYCFFFLISLFSLIGLPPLAGFIGKFYLFINALLSNFEILFVVAAYASLISAVVYLKLIRNVFFNKRVFFFSFNIKQEKVSFYLVVIMLFNLFFFIFPFYFFFFVYNVFFFIYL